tara:strand:+ start:688 stop:1509 length:822 start_codon:yes stop_codon:yes gene_type:complete
MSAEVIPFDFEEQAVRVVMRDDDPWFVAADVCRVLELGNPSQALTRLDEDEVTLITNEGNHRPTNVINESGLYALVLTSRKEQAKRFRKWITAEVLPAIRKFGRYDHQLPEPTSSTGDIAGVPIREAELWLQMVREARLSRGTRAAVSIWDRSPLPRLTPVSTAAVDPAEGSDCLAHIMAKAADRVAAARTHDEDANNELSSAGLRVVNDGLFVGNGSLPIFEGTRWASGLQRLALLSIPGAHPSRNPLTMAGVRMRGVIVPWATCEEVQANG